MQTGARRRRGWVLVPVLVLAGLSGAASGSIPENPGTFGAHLWAARYNGPANSSDGAYSLAVSPDGSTVFATGESDDADGFADYATVAYSATTGAELWAARYNGPANSDDRAYSLAVSPDGSTVFVTGESLGGSFDYATVAYAAATGVQLWVARYNGPANSHDVARSLAVSPDGTAVFVTGYSVGLGSSFEDYNYDYATLAYSAATGSQLWIARYNGPGNFNDRAYSLAMSPDNSTVFVTGESVGLDGSADYATLAYSTSSGAQVWAARYNGPGNDSDVANSLAVSPDNSTVFVTGYSDGSGSSADYATLAYSASSGAQVWAARYNGPGNDSDVANSLAVSPDNSTVFVTGESAGPSVRSKDYATLAYSASSGAEIWAARYNRPTNTYDGASSLALSPDGSKVFVTGRSDSLGVPDYATLAYSAATGAELWAARYNGPANYWDEASSLAVSPDGSKVFVTGYSYGSGTSADYATLAYSANTCANGKDEAGPASDVVHDTVESQAGPGAPYIHGVNCDVVAANGL